MIHALIHPKNRNIYAENYRQHVSRAWGLVAIFTLHIVYSLVYYFRLSGDHFQNRTNVITLFVIIFIIFLHRCTSKVEIPALLMMSYAFYTTYNNILVTGGIYSIKFIWLTLYIIFNVLIVSSKFGVLITCVSISVVIYMTHFHTSDLEKQIAFENISPKKLQFIWIQLYVEIITILLIFNNSLKKSQRKLKELNQNKIEDLNNSVQIVTHNLSNLRNKLASDFHDEVGNTLASINILTKSLAFLSEQNKQEELKATLKKIENNTEKLTINTRDFIWSIKSKSDYSSELYAYLKEFGQSFLSDLNIDFIPKNHDEDAFFLKTNVSLQIIFVCKEIITNAAKHSQCTNVQLIMYRTEKKMSLVIIDNGIGFDKNKLIPEKHSGIKNIKQRLKKLNAEYSLQSNSKGTTWKFSIPISKNIND